MTNKTKKVKFEFYRSILVNDDIESLFDLDDCFNEVSKVSLEERNYNFKGNVIRCDEIGPIGNTNDLTTFHFTKLRVDDVPAITKLNQTDLDDVQLEEDEYIAEDISGLYDSSNHVMMLQRNIHSLSVKGVESYLKHFWDKKEKSSDQHIELRPIARKDVLRKVQKSKKVKKATLRLGNSQESYNFGSKLGLVMKDMNKLYKGAKITVSISSSRKKNDYLDSTELSRVIDDIINDNGQFTQAEFVTQDEGFSDSLDLLHAKLCIWGEFSLPPKKRLRKESVQSQMYEIYSPEGKNYKQTVDKNL